MTHTGPPIVVTGWGRCGTTLAMLMLRAGGIPWADGSNPASGELTGPAARHPEDAAAPGRAVKIILADPRDTPRIPAAASIIWMRRNPREQARSIRKFERLLIKPAVQLPERLLISRLTDWTEIALADLDDRGIPVLEVWFEDALADPHGTATLLTRITPSLETAGAAAVVQPRRPECAHDLSIELGLVAAAGRR